MEKTVEVYETGGELKELEREVRLETFIPRLEKRYPDLTDRVVNFLRVNKIRYPRHTIREKITDTAAPVILAGLGRMLEDMGKTGFSLGNRDYYRSFFLNLARTFFPGKIEEKISEVEARLISVVELFPNSKEEVLNIFEEFGQVVKEELEKGKSPKQIIWDTLHIDPHFHRGIIEPLPQKPSSEHRLPRSKILETLFLGE